MAAEMSAAEQNCWEIGRADGCAGALSEPNKVVDSIDLPDEAARYRAAYRKGYVAGRREARV